MYHGEMSHPKLRLRSIRRKRWKVSTRIQCQHSLLRNAIFDSMSMDSMEPDFFRERQKRSTLDDLGVLGEESSPRREIGQASRRSRARRIRPARCRLREVQASHLKKRGNRSDSSSEIFYGRCAAASKSNMLRRRNGRSLHAGTAVGVGHGLQFNRAARRLRAKRLGRSLNCCIRGRTATFAIAERRFSEKMCDAARNSQRLRGLPSAGEAVSFSPPRGACAL